MGQLVEGIWQDVWYDTKSTGGRFKRSNAQFRNWITPDGSLGPNGESGFAAEKIATISMSPWLAMGSSHATGSQTQRIGKPDSGFCCQSSDAGERLDV